MLLPKSVAKQIPVVNQRRRMFLTAGFAAVVTFVASRFIKSSQLFTEEKIIQSTSFENFDLIETADEIRLSERGGEPIFIIDKASFRD